MAQRKPKRWKLKIRKYTINIFYRGRTRPCNRLFCGGRVFPSKESKKTGVCQACGRTAPSPLLWYHESLRGYINQLKTIKVAIAPSTVDNQPLIKNSLEVIQARSIDFSKFLEAFGKVADFIPTV
jgi:hypothetical protein